MVIIGAELRAYAARRGLKLWVTKHEDHEVLNVYCRKRDRMLCNFDGYNKNYMRGKRKIMSEEGFQRVPLSITSRDQMFEAIRIIHAINEAEKNA